ncbi:Gti1/Pac2 family-domain-containing protein [Mycena filopes]|nr:Gti1/Pac2 family-domain-containing protein [Mycena filopes]
MGTVQSLVAKKLCCEMVRALKDIGVDVLQLGSVQDDDDPPFDYDGLDFLAATMLVAFSRWFQKLDEQDRAHQPWYDPLREILQLLRAPRSVDLLPMANGCAIGIWSVLLPLRWKSVELNVTAICKDGDGLSDTQNMSDPPRDDPPLASVTGALLEDDQSEAESSDEANPSNSEDSRSTESTEVNDAPKDELEIDPATAPPEKPNARKRGRIWRGLRRTWKDSFQKSRLRTGSDDVSDGKATSDPTRENFGGHEDRLNSVPKHGDAEDDEEGGEDNLSAEKSDVQLGSDTASTRDPSTETASEKHDRLQHPSNPEDEENNSSVNDGNTRAHPVGIVNPHNSRDIEVNTIFDSSGLNVVPSQPPAQQPTCTNLRIRSADDANKILFAVHCNILHPVTRRLDRDERAAIRAGCVFAWEERSYDNQIGIERFTDSKRWSPSRTWNEFLFYYQRWGPDPNQPRVSSPEVTEPPPGWVPLIKQTYSVWVQTERGRRKWHLTAYLTQATVGHLGTVDYSAYDRLGTLDDMPDVRSLEVPPHVFRSTRRRRNPDPDPATTAGAPISAAFPAPITPHLEASNSPAFSAIQSTQTQRPRSPGPHRGAGEP